MDCVLTRHLAKRDFVDLLTLSHQALACTKLSDLKCLVSELNRLFAFENAVCAQGNLLELIEPNIPPTITVCDVSYPDGYLDLYLKKKFYYTDAVFLEFITNLAPVNWLDVDQKCGFNYPASVIALDFNMNDGWSHGTLDIDTLNSTVFFFGGPTADHDIRTEKILEYIIPFYSQAYKRVLKMNREPKVHLTKREIEVLNWIKEGKSSWEISMILNCAKRTVEFHIVNIKNKLCAVSRAQAVAIGLEHGFIQF